LSAHRAVMFSIAQLSCYICIAISVVVCMVHWFLIACNAFFIYPAPTTCWAAVCCAGVLFFLFSTFTLDTNHLRIYQTNLWQLFRVVNLWVQIMDLTFVIRLSVIVAMTTNFKAKSAKLAYVSGVPKWPPDHIKWSPKFQVLLCFPCVKYKELYCVVFAWILVYFLPFCS